MRCLSQVSTAIVPLLLRQIAKLIDLQRLMRYDCLLLKLFDDVSYYVLYAYFTVIPFYLL